MTAAAHDDQDLTALAGLASQLASTFVALASDIALVIDADGSVRHVAQNGSPLAADAQGWIGRPWSETVTRDTRGKIDAMLKDVSSTGVARRREVNLPSPQGESIPVSYAAIRLGADGPVLAVGRDLRAISAIQQRFTETQQEMERDYWKRREAESRYRLLFQVATDAVFVVDALTLAIVEANRAAGQLFGLSHEQLAARPLTVGVDRDAWPALEELLAAARGTGRAAEIRVRLADGRGLADVSATPFRAERDLFLMVRARAVADRAPGSSGGAPWAELMQRLADAVVVTDSSGGVLMANPAFAELCELSPQARLDGRPLGLWLGDGLTLPELLGQVKRHGIVRSALALRGERGGTSRVDVSAALLDDGDRECVGFTLRPSDPLPAAAAAIPEVDDVAAAIDALVALMGRKPLPELLQAATGLAEQHFLRSALHRSGGDRDAAAALLGIGAGTLAQRIALLGVDGASEGQAPRAS